MKKIDGIEIYNDTDSNTKILEDNFKLHAANIGGSYKYLSFEEPALLDDITSKLSELGLTWAGTSNVGIGGSKEPSVTILHVGTPDSLGFSR